MAFSDNFVHTRHAEICVRESTGQGLPLVMIHGSGASREVFVKQFESPLAESYRMLALDLPGHGESGNAMLPAEEYTIKGFAQTVGEVLDQLGVERAVVYGWSLGGHIGIELTSWHPAVAGLMITGAPPISRGPLGMLRGFQTHRDVFLAGKAVFSDADVRRFAHVCYGGDETEDNLDSIRRADGRARQILTNGMMRGIGADQRKVVETSDVPVAVVNGSDEPFARLGYVASLKYANLWEGECHVIPDGGHAPFLKEPEAFNALLGRFAADVAAGEAARPAEAPVAIAQSA